VEEQCWTAMLGSKAQEQGLLLAAHKLCSHDLCREMGAQGSGAACKSCTEVVRLLTEAGQEASTNVTVSQ